MKVDLIERQDLVFGAAQIISQEGEIILKRMTADLDKFYSYSEGAVDRAVCTSGIRIRFVSDSSYIKLDVKYGRKCRQIFNLDLIVDGQDPVTVGPDDCQETYTAVFDGLGDNKKLLEIYLPHCCEICISELELADGAEIEMAPSFNQRWLFIGDSITQGMTAANPAATVSAIAARNLGVDFHNVAVGGAVMKGEVGALAQELDWDFATIAFGANDFNQNISMEETTNETRLMIENLLKKTNKIALITPIPWVDCPEPNKEGYTFQDYRDIMALTALEFDEVLVIPGEGIIDDDEGMFVDKVHPNNAGMKQYAEKLMPYIKRLL